MPDSNPSLTSTLRMLRDGLLTQRESIQREFDQLKMKLDQNTTQIEAADTLILAHDPEHVTIDLHSGDDAPVVHVPPRQLRIAAAAISHETAEAPAEAPVQVQAPATAPEPDEATAKPPVQTPEPEAVTEEHQPPQKSKKGKSADEAKPAKVSKTKSPSLASKQIIADYFGKMKRNEVILDILSASDEPLRAPTITNSFRDLHAINIDDHDVKTMLSSRISSTLYAMEARGMTVKTEKEVEGKANQVYWTIDPVYRNKRERELAKNARKTGNRKQKSKPSDQASQAQSVTTETAH